MKKKVVSMVLAAIMGVSLAACGSPSDDSSKGDDEKRLWAMMLNREMRQTIPEATQGEM